MSTSHSPEFINDVVEPAAEDRPRKSRGVVVLLSLLTLANLVVLLLTVNAWVDATTHGDEYAGLLAFSIVTTVVGLVGLGAGVGDPEVGAVALPGRHRRRPPRR